MAKEIRIGDYYACRNWNEPQGSAVAWSIFRNDRLVKELSSEARCRAWIKDRVRAKGEASQ